MPESFFGAVPAAWESTTLGELCTRGGGNVQTGPFGSQLHAADYVAVGVPTVMPQNIGDNMIVEEGIARIGVEDSRRLAKYLLRTGDIVYSRRGDVERRALVRPEQDGWLCGTGCLRVRPGSAADSGFLSYYLGHPEVRAWIVRHAVGATMPNLNTTILSSLPLVLPPLTDQVAAATLLGALDDKIMLNGRVAKVARSLGMAFFEASCAAESTTVPVRSISSAVMRGGAPNYTEDQAEVIVVNQKCIRGGHVNLGPARRTLGVKIRPDRLLLKDDVLVNSTGVGTLGRVAIWTGGVDVTCDSHITIVRPDSTSIPSIVCGYAILSAQPEIELLGEGSTGQTELSRHKLAELGISLPAPSARVALGERLDALERKCQVALTENLVLSDLRDALLPKLISGELRIKHAERLVSDAV